MSSLDWRAIATRQMHPLRIAILEELDGAAEPLSPNGLTDRLEGWPLGNVSYHVRRLERDGLITLDRTAPVRGAVEHFYRLAELNAGGSRERDARAAAAPRRSRPAGGKRRRRRSTSAGSSKPARKKRS